MKWISMKDELPPIYEDIILCNKNKQISTGYVDKYKDGGLYITDYYDANDDDFLYISEHSFDEYTHWMKMPSPP